MTRYPFLWIAGGLIVGLLLGEWGKWGLLGIAFLTALVLLAWKRGKIGRTGWALVLFALLGWLRTILEKLPDPQAIQLAIGRVGYVRGYLLEEPFQTRRAWRLLIEVQSWRLPGDSTWQPARGRLLLYTKSALSLLPGDQIEALGRLDSIRFGASYWHRKGIWASAFSSEIRWIGRERGYVGGYFLRLRARLIEALQASFPGAGPAQTVLEALLLGYTRGLDPETRAVFQLTGTAHILAVSGLHVGLVLTFSLWLLVRLLPPGKDRHPLTTALLLAMMWFYGLLTGGSPPAMRAVIMGSLALIARSAYLRYDALNALGAAAFLQLLVDPLLLSDAGFGLSYLAVLGILAWYGPLQTFLASLAKIPYVGSSVKDLVAISLAAQAGTFGLSWALFGQFPLYFLLSNLVAVPLSSFLTQLGLIWLIGLSIPFVGEVGSWVVWFLSKALLFVLGLIQALPGGSLSLVPIGIGPGLLLSALLIGGGFAYQSWRHLRQQNVVV